MSDLKEPSIAVVLPNRNDARFLPRCLRSVLDQNVGADEFVVVDDQSTDNSIAVIRSLLAGQAHAQLIENPVNLGTNGALNVGLDRIQSDYVVFLASNDFLLPGIFARAKACLASAPGAALWSAMAWLVDEEDRPIRLHPSAVVALNDAWLPPDECIRLAQRFGNWFTGTTVMYHRETLRSIGGFDPAYGAPADLFTSLAMASLKGATFTPEPYAAIRVHSGSFSSRALKDIKGLEAMFDRLKLCGPKIAPRLFDTFFLDRTALRFWFAAVRAAEGGAMADVATKVTKCKRVLMLWTDNSVPKSWHRVRVVLAFLVLRPFDLLPTLWYRLLGWALIRLRIQLRGKAMPWSVGD